jgi:hypothetical protein
MANTWYSITVQYFQGNGSASMDLSWSDTANNIYSEDIPLSDLSTTEPSGPVYTGGFTLDPTVTVQGDTNTYSDGTYGIQQTVIGVSNSSGTIVDGLTSYGALQGSNSSGLNVAGGNIIVAGGQGTGSASGGSIDFQVAPASGSGLASNNLLTVASISGVNGAASFENSTNSSNAFDIQNSTGFNIFNVDTTNGAVAIGSGTNTPANLLSIGALTTAASTYQIAVTTGGTTNSGIVVQDVASQSSGYGFTLQSSAGINLASIDYQGNLIVKNATINGNLTLNGHIVTANASGSTTATVNANAGTGATCTITGDDTDGQITLTTGTASWVSGIQCSINFSSSFTNAPYTVITPTGTTNTSAVNPTVSNSTTGFTINFLSADTASHTYTWNYVNLD